MQSIMTSLVSTIILAFWIKLISVEHFTETYTQSAPQYLQPPDSSERGVPQYATLKHVRKLGALEKVRAADAPTATISPIHHQLGMPAVRATLQ